MLLLSAVLPANAAAGQTIAGADFDALLRQVGEAEGEAAERSMSEYLARGSPALLAAAHAVLDQALEDNPRDRGARLVLMSLRNVDDFSFLEKLELPKRPSMKVSCEMTELIFFLGQSVQFLELPLEQGADADEERMTYVPGFARFLLRVIERSWPVCVESAPSKETSYSHPQATALELMNEMVHWQGDDLIYGHLAREWSSAGPAEVKKFERWWRKNGARFPRRPASSRKK